MPGLTNLLGIGVSALTAAQRALSTTGHNIANVSTPGFSRQEVVLTETQPENAVPGQIGTGVEVTEIRRSLDAFVEDRLLASHEQLGRFGAARSALTRIEPFFGDSVDQGLGAGFNEFFAALQDVATNPSDLTARRVLLSKASTLAGRFNQAANDLVAHRQSLDRQIGQGITDINRLAAQIAELNAKISQAELSGQQANDLRDQRGRLVSELAGSIDISTVEDSTRQLTIFVGRGQVLVDKNRTNQLVGVPVPSNGGLLDVALDPGVGAPINLSGVITSGRLKGLLEVRDQVIPAIQSSLDTLSSELVSQVNQQHQLGFGLDGSTGLNFFSPGGLTAGMIGVTLTDPRQIAVSGTAAGVPGNNTNALSLAALQQASFAALGNTTYQGYYSALAANFGSTTQAAEQDLQAQELLHEQLEVHRAEVSGVSLDEELVNLLKYQRAFEAASRVIVVTDELFQTILSLKR